MSNTFILKHGQGIPADNFLQPYELGYARDYGLLIGNDDGKATSVKVANTIKLSPFLNRPTSANISTVNDGSISTFKVSASTTIGAPDGVGTILHSEGDGSEGYSSQLFLPNSIDKSLQYRAMDSSSTWGEWKTIIDSENIKNNMQEAFLTWGGKNLVGTIAPVDCAASNLHNANRFAYADTTGVIVEYSTDNGVTYVNYEAAKEDVIKIISNLDGAKLYLGKNKTDSVINNRLRITLNGSQMKLYARLRKLLIRISSPSHVTRVLVEQSTYGTPNTFTAIGDYQIYGWSGWNSIPLDAFLIGSSQNTINSNLRLTFYCTSLNSNEAYKETNVTILNLVAIGDDYWRAPSEMARTGHLYSYDATGTAIFPNNISLNDTNAKFIGNLQGKADSATKAYCDGQGDVITEKYTTFQDISISDNLPIIPIDKGGSGKATAEEGIKNLLANGRVILSSNQYGYTLPETDLTEGMLYFLIQQEE